MNALQVKCPFCGETLTVDMSNVLSGFAYEATGNCPKYGEYVIIPILKQFTPKPIE